MNLRSWIFALLLLFVAHPASALTMEIKPVQSEYYLGEPLAVGLEIHNDGDQPVVFVFDFASPNAVEFEIAEPKRGIEKLQAFPSMGGLQIYKRVGPGQTFKQTCILSDCYIIVDQPGEYSLKAQVKLRTANGNAKPIKFSDTPVTLSTAFSIKVLPADEQILRDKLAQLKQAILKDSFEYSKDRDEQLILLLHYTDPHSVDVVADVYNQIMPSFRTTMIQEAEQNRTLGKDFLKRFDAETDDRASEIKFQIKQALNVLDSEAKFQGSPSRQH